MEERTVSLRELYCGHLACVAPTFGKPGDPCGVADHLCLTGTCPLNDMGIVSGACPTIIADGQPCTLNDPTSSCDTQSNCTNGVCAPIDSVVCVQPDAGGDQVTQDLRGSSPACFAHMARSAAVLYAPHVVAH